MLALDAHPAVAQAAQQVARIEDRLGTRTLQVEDAALTGDAQSGGAAVDVDRGVPVRWHRLRGAR